MRYLPLTDADRAAMLEATGARSITELFADVPRSVLLDAPVDLPAHQPEMAVEKTFNGLAMKNLSAGCAPSFLGAGAYRHHLPASVDHLIQRGEFLTSYTPYQPEVSQGTLQYLFEFQTQVANIAGLDVANASLYDGATATAEAVMMAARATRRSKAVLSGGLHPHWAEVVKTQSRFLDFHVEDLEADPAGEEDLASRIDAETACVVVQNPDVFGRVRDFSRLAEVCREDGVLLVVAVAEAVSLGAVKSPGAMGADVYAGEGQSLGNPLGFGGPYLGLYATRNKYLRQMPGRLVGETVDSHGSRGYVLTLSTREQHIRREKATSNICTNSGLCALAFTIHLTLLGGTGLAHLARLNHAKAVRLADTLAAVDGVDVLNSTFFNEFTVRLPGPADEAVEALAAKGILAGVPGRRLWPGRDDMRDLLLVAATETNSDEDMDALAGGLREVLR